MGRGDGDNLSIDSSVLEVDHKRKYLDAVQYLDDNFAFFLTNVLNIGKPKWSNSAGETAAVGFPDLIGKTDKELKELDFDKLDVQFFFNPDFAKRLTPEEMGFVCAHETMHVLLNHPAQMMQYKDKGLFNIAADLVINDFLINNGIDEPPEGVCLGPEILDMDCSNMTVGDVYELLSQKKEEKGSRNESESGAGVGKTEETSYDDFGTPIDSHSLWEGISKEGMEQLENYSNDAYDEAVKNFGMDDVKGEEIESLLNDRETASGIRAGTGTYGDQEWKGNPNVSLKWKELLEEVDPDMFSGGKQEKTPMRPSFHRRRRNLSGFNNTILPTEIEDRRSPKRSIKKDKPVIVMALDTSGSIGAQYAKKFITLAKTIPQDKVELQVCTFTDSYRTLDLDDPLFSSGGTNFSAIEKFIREKVIKKDKKKKYPKAVLVITDGFANFNRREAPSREQLENNWRWLINHDSSVNCNVKDHIGLRDSSGLCGYFPVLRLDDYLNR